MTGKVTVRVQLDTEPPLQLTRAILIYENSARALASVHSVSRDVKGRPCLGEGRVVTAQLRGALLRRLRKGGRFVGYLPESVVASEDGGLIWYEPPMARHLFFKQSDTYPERSIGTRAARVQLPGIVMTAGGRIGWNVFALKEGQRPTPSTPLWCAPFFNVDRDGRICAGNVRTPRDTALASVGAWSTAFFRSNFAHANYDGQVDYPGDSPALWRDLLAAGENQPFPLHVLKRDDRTLGDLIEELR